MTELGVTKSKGTGVQENCNWGPVVDLQESRHLPQQVLFSWGQGRNAFDKAGTTPVYPFTDGDNETVTIAWDTEGPLP